MSANQYPGGILAEINEKGKALCYTRGFSMLPMLKEGRDISLLTPVNRPLRRGDIVLFVRPKKDNELVLHRIIRPTEDGFIIRGDNTYFNEPVDAACIKALLTGFFRKGKYIDCEKSKGYKFYSFLQLRLYFLRKFFLRTLRVFLANIKNTVLRIKRD